MQFAWEDQTGGGDRDFNDARLSLCLAQGPVYRVPGGSSQQVPVEFTLVDRKATFRNELGVIRVDDAQGRINGLLPGAPGYAAAALQSDRWQPVFATTASRGARTTITLPGGSHFQFYGIPRNTTATHRLKNPNNVLGQPAIALLGVAAANPDRGTTHFLHTCEGLVRFEDQLFGGDRDFNDAALKFAFGTPVGGTAPGMTLSLVADSGTSGSDRLTSDPRITGVISSSQPITAVEAALAPAGASPPAFQSVFASYANGVLSLNQADLVRLLGGPLADGAYRLPTRARDTGGLWSPVASLDFTLDTQTGVPEARLQTDTGSSATDRITSDPTLTGIATDANGVAKLEAALDRGTGTVTFTDITNRLANGQYALNPTQLAGLLGGTLDDGNYRFSVRQTDMAGNLSTVRELLFVLDTATTAPQVGLQSDTGSSATDRITSDPTLAGSASDANGVVKLEAALDRGTGAVTFTDITSNLANGQYALNPTQLAGLLGGTLDDGNYRFSVRQTDTAGNLSTVRELLFVLDTATTAPQVGLQSDTGNSATDRITSDPTLAGSASDPNGVAKLEAALDRGTGTVTFTDITHRLANGQYVLSPTDLAGLLGGALTDGSYRVSIRQTDVAGNLSTVRELLFVLDTSRAAPQVGLQNDTGSSQTDRVTKDPTLVGTATHANGVAKLEAALDRGTGTVTFTDITPRLANGQYVLSPTDLAGLLGGALEDGPYRVSVRMTTSAGVVSEVREDTFVLDRTVALPAAELLIDTGSSPTDRITRDAALKGTASDLHGVAKLEGALDGGTGSPVFQDITGNLLNGVLNLTPSDLAVLAGGPLADGVHRLSLRLTDGAGNTSGIRELVWTLDTAAPAVTLDLAPGMALPLPENPTTNLAVVTLVGTTEAGVPVVLTPGALNTNASNTGSFLYAGIALAVGDNPFTAQVTDVAGNVGSFNVTITRAVPLENCAFEPGLPGWLVSQTGGTDAGQGTVVVEGCDAVLREGDSFSVTLSRTFVVTASTTSLDFRFQSPQFDLSDPAAINDAFEAALLDADGLPLVPTYLPGRDAFWNQSEGLPATWGTSTTVAGQTVTLDLTGIPVGTTVTLMFRLVNNDDDQNTTVRMWNATVPPAATGSLGFSGGSTQPSGGTSMASPARGGAPLSEVPASGTQSAGLSGGQSGGTGPAATVGGMVGTQSSTLITDPDDPRTWLGAGVGTFAALFFGADSPANRQKVVDQQLLDAGRFDVTLARPAKLISGPSSLGPNGASQQLDSTGTGSFDYVLRGSSAEETFGGIDDLGGQTRADVGGTVFDLETLAPRVAVFNNVDHGPLPQEAIESTVYLSSDGITWTQAVTQRLWLEGWHPNPGIQWDGFTYVVGTENNTPFRYVSVIHGGAGALLDDGDNELNAVAAVDEAFNPQPLLPPNVQVADPTSGRTSAGRQIVLSGLALPGQATTPIETVLVNGIPVDALDAAGNFFAVVDILPGENRWEFVATDSLGQTATTSLTIFGTQPIPGRVDFSQFADVSGSFAVDYARTSFDNGRRILYADSAVHNQGQYPAAVPLLVGVRNLSDPSVVPLNTAGTLPDGTPYYDFTGLVTGGRLQPGGATGTLTLPFFNPSRAQFSYDLVFYGLLNRAPEFTSVPRLEAVPGREYRYTATASDLDGDMLLFRLDSAPAGMTINAQTGELRWTPTNDELGAHPIAITVSDPRGGSAEQRFQLGVIVAPPNRPPVITADTGLLGRVGDLFEYTIQATDPDQDALTYSLLSAPPGLSIAPDTGVLRWTPSSPQVGAHQFVVRVTDDRGGESTRSLVVCVDSAAGNQAPVITSEPVRSLSLDSGLNPLPYTYQVQSVDPDGDPMSYRLVSGPDGMVIDGSGQVSWTPSATDLPNLLTISDTEFAETDWTTTIIGRPDGQFGFAQSFASGGVPDAFRRVNSGITSAFAGQRHAVINLQRYEAVTYDPQVSGPVRSLSWRADVRDSGFATPAMGLAVFQGGEVFLGSDLAILTGGGWNPMGQESRLAASFFNLDETTGKPVHPDFSAAGSPIHFGFYQTLFNEAGSRGFDGSGDVDNWQVTIQPSPEIPVAVEVADPRGGVDRQTWMIGAFLGGSARGSIFVDTNQDGRREYGDELLVLNGASGGYEMVRFSTASGAVVGTITTPARVFQGVLGTSAITANSQGDLLIVDSSANRIHRVDGRTGSYKGVFFTDNTLGTFADVAIGPQGDLFLATTGTNLVHRVDGLTGIYEGIFASADLSAPQHLGFAGDTDLFVYSSLPRVISRFDAATGTRIVSTNSVDSQLGAAMAVGSDGFLYVARYEENDLYKYSTDPIALVQTLVVSDDGVFDQPNRLHMGPNNSLYVVSYGTNEVLRLDTSTGAVLRRFAIPELSAPRDVFVRQAAPNAILESGLSNWTVFIDRNRNQRRDVDEPVTNTTASGTFEFTDIPTGSYSVGIEIPAGYVVSPGTLRFQEVTITPGATSYGTDFGAVESTASIVPKPFQFVSTPPTEVTAEEVLLYRPDLAGVAGSLSFDFPVAPRGMTVNPTLGVIAWSPAADQVGEWQVVLRARDTQGSVALQSFEVRVTAPNTSPVVTSLPVGQPTVGFPFRYQVAAQDAEGDTVSFRFGNAAPAGATLQAASGTFEWTPTAGQVGPHTVKILADDGRGGVSQHVVSLVVAADSINAPPVVQFTPRAAAPIDELLVAQVVARDPNGDPLDFLLVNHPDGMTIDTTGILRWTPSATQVGRQTGRLLVSDGRGGDVSVEFAIDVVARQLNHAPVITSTPRLRATEGREYRLDLRGFDEDGDLVAWDLVTAPPGMSLDPDLGTLRWTPASGQMGSHVVVVRIRDTWGSSSTQSFQIEVSCVNQGPQIASTPPTQAAVGRTYLYAVRASDPERDPLQFTLLSAPRGNMTLNAASGLLRWTPAAADAGASVPVVIQVADGHGNLATQRFEIEVGTNAGNLPADTNAPPVITSTPVYRATLDRPYVYATTARDPEGAVVSWSLREPPAGMTIDAATGRITWTPTAAGEQVVTVVATDPLGARAIQSYLLLTARNEAPQITSTPSTTAVAGGLYRYDVSARDPEGDPLQYTLIAPPSGMTIDSVGRLRWSVPSTALTPVNVTVEVTDAFGETARQTFAITPTADVTPPRLKLMTSSQTVDSQGRVVVDLGTPLLFQVQSTDDVGTPTLSLSVDGVPLPLDTGASARWTVSRVGAVTVVATATDAAGNVSSQTLSLRVRNPNDSDAPFVEIISPNPLVDTNMVSYLTTIVGTVRDDNLLGWRLDYAQSDAVDFYNDVAGSDPDWVTFATGNSGVTSAALGVFDPTLLANGQYVVRVFAEDTSGLITVRGVLIGVQGEAKLGNFRLEFTDLQIPVAGIPITVTRVYDTLHVREEGDFGYGWSLGLRDANIRETVPDNGGDFFTQSPFKNGTRVYLTDPDGKRIGFTFQPEFRSALLFAIARPRFIPDPGVTATLEDADLQDFALFQGKDGSYHGFFGVGNYNPENYILTTSNGVRYHYNEDQGLQKVVDLNGNTLTFDDAGIHSSGGDEVLFTRDGRGRITAITDPDGNQLKYTYNAAGDLVSFRDQVDLRTTFSYLATPAHYLDEIHDPLGRRASKTIYGPDGRVEKIIDALGNETRQSFDPGSFTGTITDAKGNVTKLVYDQRGNVVREEDPEGGVTLWEYSDSRHPDNETKVILLGSDGKQIVTAYIYDAQGNPRQIIDSFGTTTFEYDTLGNVVKAIDALGRVTTAIYDGQGNLKTLVNALGDSTSRTYDSNGRVATVTDFLGHTTAMKYEPGCACGIPREIINPDGTRRYYVANEFGQVTLATDEVGVSAETVYDDGGRVVSERGPQGQETRYFYTGNDLSRKEVQINATQVRTTLYAYFDDGKLKSETDALGGVVRYTYDKNGNLETLTDPENNVTRFVYDKNNRLIEEVDPLGLSQKHEYDLFGSRISTLDRLGRLRTFGYDNAGRLLKEEWWDGGTVIRTTTYTYNAVGNLLVAADPDSHVTYAYDALGRVSHSDYTGMNGAPDVFLTNQYDRNSNRVSVTDNLGVRVVSSYDTRGRLATRSWDDLPNGTAARVDFEYLGNGLKHKIRRYSDLAALNQVGASDYTYDLSGRTDSITHRDADRTSLITYGYTYDKADQIIRQSYHGVEGNFTTTYQYDVTGQLTDVDYSRNDFSDEVYRYDLNGNRTSAWVMGKNRTYMRTPGNRYSSDGEFQYFYDHEGNLISRIDQVTGASNRFSYDYRNRLMGVQSLDSSGSIVKQVLYRYDAQNRRFSIETDLDGGGPETPNVTIAILDGVQIWAERNLSGTDLVYYLYGADLDQLLASTGVFAGAANPVQWYHGDLLGSLILTTDDVGQLQSTSLYDSFGSRFPTSLPDVAPRFAFTGRQYIPETGLYDYRSRHYLAEMGRFLTTDTIGFDSGDTNLYRYVFNSPVVFTDPFGTAVFSEYQIKVRVALARKEIIKCLGKAALDKFSEAGLYLLMTNDIGGFNAYGGRSVDIDSRIKNHIKNQVGNRGATPRKKWLIPLSKHIINNPESFRTAEEILLRVFGGKDPLLNTINASTELFCNKGKRK